MNDVDGLVDLAEGKRLYAAGQAEASRRHFQQAVERGPGLAEAWYHLGLLAFARNDWTEARRTLMHCTALDPNAWRALYYLGRVYEASGQRPTAVAAYRSSLAMHPDNADALRRVRALTPSSDPSNDDDGATLPSPASAPGGEQTSALTPARSQYGVYEVLTAATDPLLRQPLAMMDALRQPPRRGRGSAYIWTVLRNVVWALLLGYVAAQGYQLWKHLTRGAGPVVGWSTVAVLSLVAATVLLGWPMLTALTTVYSIDRGRVQIVSGILNRDRRNLELYRVIDVTLTRDVCQQLTGDATLVLTTSRETYTLVGLGSATAMSELHQQLLNLVFALRANNYVRGIIN